MINKDTNTIKKQKERTLIMKSTKATNKIVSLLLVMAMLTSVFCIPQPSVHAETEETTTVTNTKPQAEKITKKTENATVYGDGTGKKRAEIYAQDIRFKDEKGKLTDYDTSLKDITERESETGENLAAYDYQTTTTDKMTYFPQKITTKTPILSEYDQYAVKINPKETVQTGTLKKEGKEAICYCMGENVCRSTDGLDNHRTAGEVEKNIVVSPAALATAKYLEKTFGTPYEVTYPIVKELVPDMDYRRKKILIVHQQVIGNAMRAEIRRRCQKVNGNPSVDNNAVVTVASWFMMKQELSEEGDISLREEDDYMELIKKEDYDIVFADPMMKRMTEDAYKMAGTGCAADAHETERKRIFIDATHFAVSGKLREEMKKREASR